VQSACLKSAITAKGLDGPRASSSAILTPKQRAIAMRGATLNRAGGAGLSGILFQGKVSNRQPLTQNPLVRTLKYRPGLLPKERPFASKGTEAFASGVRRLSAGQPLHRHSRIPKFVTPHQASLAEPPAHNFCKKRARYLREKGPSCPSATAGANHPMLGVSQKRKCVCKQSHQKKPPQNRPWRYISEGA